jgi:hypothetical protein
LLAKSRKVLISWSLKRWLYDFNFWATV